MDSLSRNCVQSIKEMWSKIAEFTLAYSYWFPQRNPVYKGVLLSRLPSLYKLVKIKGKN